MKQYLATLRFRSLIDSPEIRDIPPVHAAHIRALLHQGQIEGVSYLEVKDS